MCGFGVAAKICQPHCKFAEQACFSFFLFAWQAKQTKRKKKKKKLRSTERKKERRKEERRRAKTIAPPAHKHHKGTSKATTTSNQQRARERARVQVGKKNKQAAQQQQQRQQQQQQHQQQTRVQFTPSVRQLTAHVAQLVSFLFEGNSSKAIVTNSTNAGSATLVSVGTDKNRSGASAHSMRLLIGGRRKCADRH